MICTSNFQKFLHIMYKYLLNLAVKISVMFTQYFDYCTIILRRRFFPWTQCSAKRVKATAIPSVCTSRCHVLV